MKRYTPENIKKTDLAPNEIFIFGSNRAGRHGAGAAWFAYKELGAKLGVGEGMTGRCYALPTKDENVETLPLSEIKKHIDNYYDFVIKAPSLVFLTTKVGTGYANLKIEDIAKLFQSYTWPSNVIFPQEFEIDNFPKTEEQPVPVAQ